MKRKKIILNLVGFIVFLVLIFILKKFVVLGLESMTEQDFALEKDTNNTTIKNYTWDFGNETLSLSFPFPVDYIGFYRERERRRDYDLFASDPYDDEIINDLAHKLKGIGKNKGISDELTIYIIISFVQSLEYTDDKPIEYPKFPYETIYDNGGDCEDRSFLISALLESIGYHTVLVEFHKEHHIGIGVDCIRGPEGYSFEFEGRDYCYLEPTEKYWLIGMLPDNLIGVPAKAIPIKKRPLLNVDFSGEVYKENNNLVTAEDIVITNLGSATAEKVKVYVELQAKNLSHIYGSTESEYFDLDPEEIANYNVEPLIISIDDIWRVHVEVHSDNANSTEDISDWFGTPYPE